MVAVINSQEIINKKLWSYRPNFLDGNKDAKSVYRLVEEVFNESIKQASLTPVVDRAELAARMGISEKTIQRACNKLMASQKIYVERLSKGQYQFALFDSGTNLDTDCIINDFDLETKLLAELEKQQQRVSKRTYKADENKSKLVNQINQIANQTDDKTTSLEISPTPIDENKINEISTTSLLLDNQSSLEVKPTSLEKSIIETPALTTKTSANNVSASRPAATATEIQAQENKQAQQVQTNLAISNSQLKNRTTPREGLFAKRAITELEQAENLFCDLTDEQQDELLTLPVIVETFWDKTGKTEILKEQWKEYYCDLDWYEFLTNKSMEFIKLAYNKQYEKLLSETKLSKDEVKAQAINELLAYWENINKVSSENIIIPPTTLSLGTDNKIDIASLSTTNQTANKQLSHFDRIMANVIKNEETDNVGNASDTQNHHSNPTSNSNPSSNKKFSVREMMKGSRAKGQAELTKPTAKKQDNNVSKNPYAEKSSGFTYISESVFSQTLGLDKIQSDLGISNNEEIHVIGIDLNQQLNESTSDNSRDFGNNDVLRQECPQIADQQSHNQNDQVLKNVILVSGQECPQINDQLVSNQNDQVSNSKVDISGHKCPQICVNEKNDHDQDNEDRDVPNNQNQAVSSTIPTLALVVDNTANSIASSTDSTVSSSTHTTTPTTKLFKSFKALKLSLNSYNLNINKKEEESFKSLRGAPGNNQGDESRTTTTNRTTETNITTSTTTTAATNTTTNKNPKNDENIRFSNSQTIANKDLREETEKQLKGKTLVSSISAIDGPAETQSQEEEVQLSSTPALRLVSVKNETEGEEINKVESKVESKQLTVGEYDYYQTLKMLERIEREEREIITRGDANCAYCEGSGRLHNIPDLYKSDNENSKINGKWKKFPEIRSVACLCAKAYDMLEYMEGREVLAEMRSLTSQELELREIMVFCLDEKAKEIAEQASQVKAQQSKQNNVVTSSKKAKSSTSGSSATFTSSASSKSNTHSELENENKAKTINKQKPTQNVHTQNIQNSEASKLKESSKAAKANKTNNKAESINWAKYANPLPERRSVPKELLPYIEQLNEKAKERTTNGKADIVIKLSADRQSWLIPNPYGQERKSVASFWDWLLYSLREPNTTQPVRMACAGYYLGNKEEEIISWLERRAELGVGGSVSYSFSGEQPKQGQECLQNELVVEDEDFNSDNVIVVDGDLSVEYGDLTVELDGLIASSNYPLGNNQQVNL